MRSFIFSGLLCLLLANVVVSLDRERDCKCRIQASKRIIGGSKADPNSFPWQVSLQWNEWNPVPDNLRKLVPENEKIILHFCGGSIIGEHWILTAAHCVFRKSISQFRVALGANDLVTLFDHKQYAEIKEVHVHPEYNGSLSDIALIELKSPLTFNATVQPACLAAQYQDHYDGALQISGFGRTERPVDDYLGNRRGAGLSRFLKEGKTFDYSDDPTMRCKKTAVICVENRIDSRGEGTCLGDSGGPLHYTKEGRSTVIGVTSFGKTIYNTRTRERTFCIGQDGFTRISTYLGWIKETAGDDLCL